MAIGINIESNSENANDHESNVICGERGPEIFVKCEPGKVIMSPLRSDLLANGWKKEKPTKNGWYWFRPGVEGMVWPSVILYFARIHDNSGNELSASIQYACDFRTGSFVEIHCDEGFWSGPIDEPEWK